MNLLNYTNKEGIRNVSEVFANLFGTSVIYVTY